MSVCLQGPLCLCGLTGMTVEVARQTMAAVSTSVNDELDPLWQGEEDVPEVDLDAFVSYASAAARKSRWVVLSVTRTKQPTMCVQH